MRSPTRTAANLKKSGLDGSHFSKLMEVVFGLSGSGESFVITELVYWASASGVVYADMAWVSWMV